MHDFLKRTPRRGEPQDAGCRDDCHDLRYLIFKSKPTKFLRILRVTLFITLFILPMFSILLPVRKGNGLP